MRISIMDGMMGGDALYLMVWGCACVYVETLYSVLFAASATCQRTARTEGICIYFVWLRLGIAYIPFCKRSG
jgi:hypothetical protein